MVVFLKVGLALDSFVDGVESIDFFGREHKLGRQFFAHQINWLLRVAESVPTRPGSELLTSINSQAPPPENSH